MIGGIDEESLKPADGEMEGDRRQSAEPAGKDGDGEQSLTLVGHALRKPGQRARKKTSQPIAFTQFLGDLDGETCTFQYRSAWDARSSLRSAIKPFLRKSRITV